MINVKKKWAISLFFVILLFFAAPVMAAETVITESTNIVTEQEITPRTNMTRIYFRNYGGVIQFRVWSITNGKWMTEWANFCNNA